MKKVTNIRDLQAAKKSVSNTLTDDQQELLLFAEYAVKMALVELSELNIPELETLGEHGESLAIEIEHAKNSLHGSKQLVHSMMGGDL